VSKFWIGYIYIVEYVVCCVVLCCVWMMENVSIRKLDDSCPCLLADVRGPVDDLILQEVRDTGNEGSAPEDGVSDSLEGLG